ncbi:MAG TPA: 5'/3'-nucleotidase SurE [Polyangiaceae bacterium]|nr:5'/3'-nucleotidase SurE [Polyangiaceae bacterium]
MADRPLLLLTNDDGYQAEGLRAMREALGKIGEVIVVAPETEQSATSHSLSLHRPLRLRRVEAGVFALDGTPADCVYVALNGRSGALPRRPDLVVSGLNHGVNLGYDVFYSGTVGAAREAALRGVKALATSADVRASRPAAAALATEVARALLAQPRQSTTPLLNLNVPPGEGPWRLRTTVLGSRVYDDEVTVAFDPRGREYMWIGGGGVTHPEALGSDTEAFDAGEASLTPLVLDLSAFAQTEFCRELVSSIGRRPATDPP